MTLHRLEVFLTVAKHLNITRVSRELHVSQPAISQEIKRLEDSLGVTLIRKSRRGVELTEAGASVRNDVETILAEISALRRKYKTTVLSLMLALGASGDWSLLLLS